MTNMQTSFKVLHSLRPENKSLKRRTNQEVEVGVHLKEKASHCGFKAIKRWLIQNQAGYSKMPMKVRRN